MPLAVARQGNVVNYGLTSGWNELVLLGIAGVTDGKESFHGLVTRVLQRIYQRLAFEDSILLGRRIRQVEGGQLGQKRLCFRGIDLGRHG